MLAEDRQRGFTLTCAPLLRLTLMRTGGNEWQLLFSYHHLLLDGQSPITRAASGIAAQVEGEEL
jgi:hypothetical protein